MLQLIVGGYLVTYEAGKGWSGNEVFTPRHLNEVAIPEDVNDLDEARALAEKAFGAHRVKDAPEES